MLATGNRPTSHLKKRLDKRRIIKSSREFSEIFGNGERSSSAYFLIITINASDEKLGFTVSSKLKGAVKRNRVKRRLRELVRLNRESVPNNKHVVFLAKPKVLDAEFEILNRDFVDLLKKIRKK